MKIKLLYYLVIFIAFIALYQYVNTTKYVEKSEERISKLIEQRETWKLEKDSLTTLIGSINYFNLSSNEDALHYYDSIGIDSLENWISDQLIDTNTQPVKNGLIPYESEQEGGFRINKIKVLNHRWIVADFSDGVYWGELIIQYFISDSKEIEFKTMAHFLYPKS